MILVNSSKNIPLLKKERYKYISRSGELYYETEDILCEHNIEVDVNERYNFMIKCIPEYLPELIAGNLLTCGLISGIEDMESLRISENALKAEVILKNKSENFNRPDTVKALEWKKEWIFDLADKFAEGTPLHKKTFAAHSCFLSRKGEIMFSCEDIGRHNALDKAIGYALLNSIDLSECIVYSSGRAPLDMVMKGIMAKIPVYVSKASPTSDAVAAAEKYGLTLICSARRDRIKIFNEQ